MALKHIIGKGEYTGSQHFLLFKQYFLLLNSFPDKKILDWFKLKAFADGNINISEKFKFVLGRVENIVGKGENADYQHFLLYPQCFQTASYTGSLRVI